ncbi:MAG: sensor histidine kinase [Woeseiaceae bacterium]
MTGEESRESAASRASLEEIVARVQQMSVENERLVRRLADGEDRFRRLARAVWQVQEDERRNVALELHDGVGQLLTALINHLRHTSGARAATADLAQSISLAESALAEVRRVSRALRPSVLDDLGLEAALRWLARTTGSANGLEVGLSWPGQRCQPGKFAETLVFRVVQEALTNIVKHAEATRVTVAVDCHNDTLRVVIEDNGVGFDVAATLAAPERGLGIRGMRDRAELFGGVLAIDSVAGGGTTVVLSVPDADT